jgi:hypothetical protein
MVYNTTNITDEQGQVIGNFTEASVFIYEGNEPQFSTFYDY